MPNITAVTSAAPVDQDTKSNAPAPQASKTEQPPDSVQISNAAKAAAAALQEATETPAQTAREAQSGDRQAQRLLARENEAHSS